MKLSLISKSLLIALPMLVLGGCGTTSSSDSESATETSAETNGAAATNNDAVQTDTIDAVGTSESETMTKNSNDTTAAILETVILFDFDKSIIKPEFAASLDAHAQYLIANTSKSVTLEGHADEKGTPEYIIALGERRAMAVATYLESMGVAQSQIKVVSYGEEKPVNPAHNESAWAENRRVELVY